MGEESKIRKRYAALLEKQYAYSQQLSEQRERQRNSAIASMNKLLGSVASYKIPDSVSKYATLMTNLGGQLYNLQDPSNRVSGFNVNDYTSQMSEYEKLAVDESYLPKTSTSYKYEESNPENEIYKTGDVIV